MARLDCEDCACSCEDRWVVLNERGAANVCAYPSACDHVGEIDEASRVGIWEDVCAFWSGCLAILGENTSQCCAMDVFVLFYVSWVEMYVANILLRSIRLNS